MSSHLPPRVREYSREVLHHGTDAFSRYSWALAFLALATTAATLFFKDIPPWISAATAILTGVFAFIAILAGGYYAWKDAAGQLRQHADFTVAATSVRFKLGGHQGQFPVGPDVQFHVTLDVRNATEQLVRLQRLELTMFDMGTNPLESEYNVIERSLYRGRDGSKPIVIPFDVEGGSRPTITIKIAVRHSFRSEEFLAAHLRNFGPYQIGFAYAFEDMAGRSEEGTIRIDGSLVDYARRVAADWKKRGVRKPLEIAREHSPELLERQG
jgi:hypothetical protein